MEKDITRVNYEDMKEFMDKVQSKINNSKQYEKCIKEKEKAIANVKKVQGRMFDLGLIASKNDSMKTYSFVTIKQYKFMRNTLKVVSESIQNTNISSEDKKKFEVLENKLNEQVKLCEDVYSEDSLYYFNRNLGLISKKYLQSAEDINNIELETIYSVYKDMKLEKPQFPLTLKLYEKADRLSKEFGDFSKNYDSELLAKINRDIAIIGHIDNDDTITLKRVMEEQHNMLNKVIAEDSIKEKI